jgi:hypothetical protein
MQIEDIKRWHWLLLGLIAGLAISFAWQDHDVVGDVYYARAEIKQPKFEQEALAKSRKSGQPILQNVRVEPPVKDYANQLRQIVVGKRLLLNTADDKEYLVPFYFYAAVPYQPRIALSEADNKPFPANGTVLDYLRLAKAKNPSLGFRYAWEFEPNWFIALCGAGGVVVVGIIWPTILNALMGAGFGRPPKTQSEKDNEAYLSRFGKRSQKPAASRVAKGPTQEDQDQLLAMNEKMQSELAAAGMFVTEPVSATVAAATEATGTTGASGVRAAQAATLDAPVPVAPNPAERQPHETEEEFRRRYSAGDFYPVARGVRKE